MNDRPNDELISAYLDGEVTGDQRRSVEKLLEDDPSARDVLEEFSDVSQMIRELPRSPAPPDLREAVQAEIGQGSVARQPAPASTRSPRLYWVASAASAAVVLIAIVSIQSLNGPSNDLAEREIAAITEPMAVADNDAVSDEAAFSGALEAPLAGIAMAESAPAGNPSSAESATSVVDIERLRSMLDGDSLPIPGEKLHDLIDDGDDVILVEYTVVDVQNMFGSVQVILAENGIEHFGDSDADVARNATDSLYGIYVDAPDETLLAALDAIQTLDGVVSVVTTSVNESRDDSLSEESRILADAASEPTPSDAPVPPSAPASRNRGVPSSETSKDGRDRASGEVPKAARQSSSAEADRDSDAYQLAVPLSDLVVQRVFQEQKPAEVQEAAQEEAESDASPAQAAELADSSEAPAESEADAEKPRPRRRVVIVFVESTRDP